MFRYKQLLSPKFTLRNYNTQVSEALENVKEMNKVMRFGMPVRQQKNSDCKKYWDQVRYRPDLINNADLRLN
ncbi:Mobile element protein [Candidatus Enterovibrio escicola]|uniref:Mobile element protein n=1 Tax=Candidatus Enterovibrio escicola TaxID=1927127 RepID=A0A2A5T7Q5_9GAMM|nr:Mobile element protein [Candidatus Enterovibrio escacola]